MAIVKLWSVYNRLDHVLDYAMNKDKTEEQFYVSGINCLPEVANEEFYNVKNGFNKANNKIIAFHATQSFVGREVSPEKAHEIGMILANEIWGDRFQVVVTTHLDKKNIHNHFVINSTSFVDGKAYSNCKYDKALLRETNDNLCREYGLNVLEENQFNKNILKQDTYGYEIKQVVDYAIRHAWDWKDFVKIIDNLGYEIKEKNETISVKRQDSKKWIRLERRYGNKYSDENVRRNILEIIPTKVIEEAPVNKKIKGKFYVKGNFKAKGKKGSFLALCNYFDYEINIRPKLKMYKQFRNESQSKIIEKKYQAEVKKMQMYSDEAKLLANYKLDTLDDLQNFKQLQQAGLYLLNNSREDLYKKLKKETNPEKVEKIENEIRNYSRDITEIQSNVKLAIDLEKRSKKLAEQIKEEKQGKLAKEQKKAKNKSKNKNRNSYSLD